MELKDFIKGVIRDITEAVKECQDELSNGAIISPTNSAVSEKIKSTNGDLKISYIDFEVAVSATSSVEANGETKRGIEVGGAGLGISIAGKFGGKVKSEGNKQIDENVSKICFSIPIVYPSQKVTERVSRTKVAVGRI